ncbi:hypothetical protein ASG90_01070 [Nocardioides sp. Soil797]|nr:hypothetical protein ASG90_01070 [Nocardioides sp. Soil797]
MVIRSMIDLTRESNNGRQWRRIQQRYWQHRRWLLRRWLLRRWIGQQHELLSIDLRHDGGLTERGGSRIFERE